MLLPRVVPMKPLGIPKNSARLAEAKIRELSTNAEWVMELKYDGYRCLVQYDGEVIQLGTKNEKQFHNMTVLERSVKAVFVKSGIRSIILDSEAVCLDDQGKPDFSMLCARSGSLVLYVFDLLFLNGEDLRGLPLIERKRRLVQVQKQLALKAASEASALFLYAHGISSTKEKIAVFAAAIKYKLEGFVYKHLKSTYGDKDLPWYKIRRENSTEDSQRKKMFSAVHSKRAPHK